MTTLQTLLVHHMVSVIQAVVRGVSVRKWFRASLMEASSRISDRAYFKRLAGIGCSSGNVGTGGDGLDILAQQVSTCMFCPSLCPAQAPTAVAYLCMQVRDEEEYDAMGTPPNTCFQRFAALRIPAIGLEAIAVCLPANLVL